MKYRVVFKVYSSSTGELSCWYTGHMDRGEVGTLTEARRVLRAEMRDTEDDVTVLASDRSEAARARVGQELIVEYLAGDLRYFVYHKIITQVEYMILYSAGLLDSD